MTTPETYDECLDAIEAETSSSVKLELIALLPSLRGEDNPNYLKGLQLIAKQTDTTVKQSLTSEIYKFVKVGTTQDYEPFNYVISGYIDKNPGIVGNSFNSYVGVYFDDIEQDDVPQEGLLGIWDDNYVWNDDDIWQDN